MDRRRPARVAALAVATLVAALASLVFAAGDGEKPQASVASRGTSVPASTTVPSALATSIPPPTSAPPPPTTTIPLVDGVAFVGDSLAENLAKGLATAGPQWGIPVFDDSISGCGVTRSGGFRLSGVYSDLHPTCAAWSVTWAERLRRDRPKMVAIQVGRHEVLDRIHNGSWTSILDAPYRAYVRGELELAVRIASAEGAKVVLLTAPKFHRPDRPGGGQWPENDPARVDRFNGLLRELAAADRTLRLIELGARTSPGPGYIDVVDGVDLRSDGVHYSSAGVAWIGPWLFPQLAALR